MTAATQLKETSAEATLIEAALAMHDTIATWSDAIEQQRRLPQELVSQLKAAGFFRMTMPRAWGGLEVDPITQLQVLEILAEADASVAWCVKIGSDTGYFSAFIDQQVAREMFADPDTITGSTLTTTAQADRVPGGYQVSGRMPFSSGCQHSDWFVLGCLVYDKGVQCFHDNGVPVTRQCFVPARAVKILDTWDTIGLRGSGSHDLEINDWFVPEAQSFSFQDIQCHRPSPLYAFPMSILLNFSSVPLGIARAALNDFAGHAHRPTRMTLVGEELAPLKNLCDEYFVQDTLGRCAAALGASRAYLYTTIDNLWSALCSGQPPTPEQIADFQLMHTQVFESCKDVVERVYKISGGGAVYRRHRIERQLRDMLTVNQHVINSLRSYAAGGRMLLGLPPEQILL